ncbi:hypothetical protein KDA_65300 [Dictyobacter alpinus]|uniref:Dienelactone hydrolase domain-containing protein n=1 Tax=Dictyobacter alpinus TaxID=2014873 RepID=A0A402BIA1_9CHLR|nr:dienelactone hydrolase family protein [Dictyobacter alpinus]GCE31046.1 hypothetical protein KDA_65300 [Dictyobacter alpinus]
MLIHSQIVEFKGDGTSTYGYLAHPKGDSGFPAVVVLQEWWGIDTHIQQVTEHLAQEGFAALAPDLYRGQVATTTEEAQELSQKLDRVQALQEIEQAIHYLETSPLVQAKQVGMIGFGMGASLAAMLASTGQKLGALVLFYGGRGDPENSSHEEAIQAMNAPFLGIYGGEDQAIPVDYVRWLEEKLTTLGKEHRIIVYPEASRSFLNPGQEAYRPDDASDAWSQTVTWLQDHLAQA